MADKKSGVERERLGRPVDELVTGRAPGIGERPGDYTAGELAGQPGGARTTPHATPTPPATRDAKPEKRTRELRAEIERTREDMSETVDAIQERLRPGNIAANAAASIRETASETTRDIAESEPVMYARANPIPIAMIGAGLAGVAWLAFGGRDASEARYRGRYPRGRAYADEPYARQGRFDRLDRGPYGDYSRGASVATDASGGMAERLGDVADDVRDRAGDAARRARRSATRARTTLQRTWDDNPLLLGAASAVLGALIGMAVPETDMENEWMGERRDDMIEGVQQAVREKVEDVQNVAADAANQVKEAVGIKDEG
jgi:hypothetical protein